MGLKIPTYTIVEMTNQDPRFYALMGPFLSRREIVAELGFPVWDDDDKHWLIAQTSEAAVLGFIAVQPAKTGSWIRSLYVLPDARHEVIGAALLYRVLSLYPAPFRATATNAGKSLFSKFDFIVTGTHGSFTTMQRTAAL